MVNIIIGRPDTGRVVVCRLAAKMGDKVRCIFNHDIWQPMKFKRHQTLNLASNQIR